MITANIVDGGGPDVALYSWLRSPSAVSLLAVADGVDVEDALVLPSLAGITALAGFFLAAFFGEAHAEITDAQTLFAAQALERFYPAHAGLGEPANGDEDLHGGLLRDGANVGFGVRRRRSVSLRSPMTAHLLHREA
jgi:hypothetical protein